MSGGGVGQGAVYSPLPQSISDTDSSEEELNNIAHHNDNRKFIVASKDTIDKNNGKKMGEYRQLGHDGEGEVSINGLTNRDHATADDIPIIKPDGVRPRNLEAMSPLRKVCFILSILICGLTIVVFLWLIPCDWATCPSAPLRLGTRSWETTLQGVELKGGISVVAGVPGRGRNLVFLARGDVINAALGKTPTDRSKSTFSANGGGLVSLTGSAGEVAWYIPLPKMPKEMDCTLIDVTDDGTEDCIILGSGKLLAAINPISGCIEWYVHNHTNHNEKVQHNETVVYAVDMEFPIIIPDVDGDGVKDMVTACSFDHTKEDVPVVTQRNNLVLISGKMGKFIGQAYTDRECPRISGLSVGKDWTLYYFCHNNTSASSRQLPVDKLYYHAVKKQLNTSAYMQNLPLKQHHGFGTMNRVNKVGGHQLNLVNQGHCPNHCKVYIQVTNKHGESIMSLNQTATHGMTPVVLVFNNNTNGKEHVEPVSGFVLKIWTWITGNGHIFSSSVNDIDNLNMTSSNPLFRSRLRRSSEWNDGKYSHRLHRSVKPTLQQISKNGSSPQLEVHQLKERIVLVTFNANTSHTVNASLHDITQLCFQYECQPDLTFQEQSLLIADLDQDGSQELITYLTTFTNSDPDDTSPNSIKWHLQSKVRVVRLEAELPKLYDAVSRQ
ncbi:hypothetical protein L9F63_004064 [Diploptera punctata]|uniref:FAM234A/B beta-propeller domain-containing protein n=1 Tax=Diploptera punctata TaxID=6984 RepID=A0AAD7ZGV8_DIPPU|nr:hypothetical protein L9F63_004064 [Diploptera punctata]